MKVALVTGSAVRLGREIALRLAAGGFFTWVHYKGSRGEAERTLGEIRKAGGTGALAQGDVGRLEEVEAMMARIRDESGRLDLLVNNVGIYRTGPLIDYPAKDFELTLQTNLVGSFYMISRSIPLFPASGGSIVNIGYSGIGNITSSTHNTAYLVSKSGLYVLTKSYAEALGPRNIRVNMVSPGILDNSVEIPADPPEFVPMGHLGRCADICDAVEFFAGEKAAYVTGTNLDVAGGYMLGLRGFESG